MAIARQDSIREGIGKYNQGDTQIDERTISELANEFMAFMGEEYSNKSFSEIMSGLYVNGKTYDISILGEIRSKEYAMAYVMTKIKEASLYQTDNPTFFSVKRENRFERAEIPFEATSLPEKPKEMGGFKTFLYKAFGFFEQEHKEYEKKYAQYRAYEQKKKYADKYNSVSLRYEEKLNREAGITERGEERVTRQKLGDLLDRQKNQENLERLAAADSKGHINSKEYKNFENALDKVNKLWGEYANKKKKKK